MKADLGNRNVSGQPDANEDACQSRGRGAQETAGEGAMTTTLAPTTKTGAFTAR